jgi:hypothetical protein
LSATQQRGSDAGRGRRLLVADDGKRPERKGQHRGDERSGAVGVVADHLAVAEDRERRGKRAERQRQRDHAPLAVVQRECAPDAAEQPRQGVRAQAGRPLAFGLIALRPAALDADDEADREARPPTARRARMYPRLSGSFEG